MAGFQAPCAGRFWAPDDNLQDALYFAVAGDQVWVAQGTYYPDEGALQTNNDPDATFELKFGVGIYGGFLGGETQLHERNPEKNTTTLSGLIDISQIDPVRSHHVVYSLGVTNTAVLSGFTIAHGDATDAGGGMAAHTAGPTVTRCTFRNNDAGHGAAVYLANGARGQLRTPRFVNCSFLGNDATGLGGAIYSVVTLFDAGIDLTLTNCLFSGNTAQSGGGAVATQTTLLADPDATNKVTFINCTLTENTSSSGHDGIHNQGPPCANGGPTVTVRNSILWHNGGTAEQDQIDLDGSFCQVTVTDSCIQGLNLLQGNGNIGSDPAFCNALGPDGTPGTLDDNARLQDGSLCIDTASDPDVACDYADVDDDGVVGCPPAGEILPWDRDNERPLSQWGRLFNQVSGPNNTEVDMGAYENQHIAACKWDISSSGYTAPPDGYVGNPDYLMLLADWGACVGCGADFNCNLVVDTADYNDLLAHWGACPGGGAPGGGGSAPQGGSGSSLEEALLILGFYSVDDYIAWNEQASEGEVYEVALLLAALLGGG